MTVVETGFEGAVGSGYIDAELIDHPRSRTDFEAPVENHWTSVVAVTAGTTDPMLRPSA